jgi:hypothetical protein
MYALGSTRHWGLWECGCQCQSVLEAMCFSKFNLHVGERENAGLLEKPIYRTKPKDEDYPGISWSCYSAVLSVSCPVPLAF